MKKEMFFLKKFKKNKHNFSFITLLSLIFVFNILIYNLFIKVKCL